MAKKKRSKQLSVGKILALKPGKIEKMSAKELRKITTFLNSAANKRLKRAAQLGTKSEVLRKAADGGRFKTTRIGRNVPESEARPIAYAEFMRVREFMKKETSSTRGVKKTQHKIIQKFKKAVKKLGVILGGETEPIYESGPDYEGEPFELWEEISEQDLNDIVWTQVDKLAETKALTKEMRYRAAEEAYEQVQGGMRTKEEVYEHLKNWADENYIKEKEQGVDISDEEINKFFRGLRR